MKIRSIVMLLGFVLSLGAMVISCTKGQNFDGFNSPKTEKAFLSFKFSSPDMTAKSNPVSSDANASQAEVAVSSVVLLLFDQATSTLRYSETFPISNDNGRSVFYGVGLAESAGAAAATKESFVASAIEVDIQPYYMVLAANPGTKLNFLKTYSQAEAEGDVSLASKLSDLNTIQKNRTVDTYATLSDSGYTDFFMMNCQGPVAISTDMLQSGKAEAEALAPLVQVMRTLAKVKVTRDQGFTVKLAEGTAILESACWKLDITNRKTYLMRQFDGLGEVVGSPAENWYAKDPNMNISGISDISLEYEFNRVALPFVAGNSFSVSGSHEYVLENTMNPDNQTTALTDKGATCVALCAVITPDGYSAGQSYYSFNNHIFTHEQAKDWVAGSGFPSTLESMDAALASANNQSMVFDFSAGGSPPSMYVSSNGITYHAGGMNVYYIPVRHFADAADINILGYYGIVRNNVYQVNIKSIWGPGTPVPDESMVHADIRMLPWVMRTQDVVDLYGE